MDCKKVKVLLIRLTLLLYLFLNHYHIPFGYLINYDDDFLVVYSFL